MIKKTDNPEIWTTLFSLFIIMFIPLYYSGDFLLILEALCAIMLLFKHLGMFDTRNEEAGALATTKSFIKTQLILTAVEAILLAGKNIFTAPGHAGTSE